MGVPKALFAEAHRDADGSKGALDPVGAEGPKGTDGHTYIYIRLIFTNCFAK